jgi:hypothetical protein
MIKIKNFAEFLLEKKDYAITANFRLITETERAILKAFQNMVAIVWKYDSDKDFASFKAEIKPYLDYPFAMDVKNYLAKINTVEQERAAVANTDIIQQHTSLYDKVLKTFMSGKIVPADIKELDKLNSDLGKIRKDRTSVKFYNPFKLTTSIFFDQKSLIKNFDKNDVAAFIDLDLTNTLYTYLNFPTRSLLSFDRLVYFIRELSATDKPKAIPYDMIKIYSSFINDDNEDYAKLQHKVHAYLFDNDRKQIPVIMEEIKKYPELVAANEASKDDISIVYRGVGFWEEDLPIRKSDVIKHDKNEQYVAASESKYTATLFAKMMGHMDTQRRSKIGYVLTYEVSPNSIVLDTGIFGSAYGEDEILIDVTKAQLKEINRI